MIPGRLLEAVPVLAIGKRLGLWLVGVAAYCVAAGLVIRHWDIRLIDSIVEEPFDRERDDLVAEVPIRSSSVAWRKHLKSRSCQLKQGRTGSCGGSLRARSAGRRQGRLFGWRGWSLAEDGRGCRRAGPG